MFFFFILPSQNWINQTPATKRGDCYYSQYVFLYPFGGAGGGGEINKKSKWGFFLLTAPELQKINSSAIDLKTTSINTANSYPRISLNTYNIAHRINTATVPHQPTTTSFPPLPLSWTLPT